MGVSFNSNTAGGFTFGNGVTSFTSTSGGTALFTAISGPFHYYLPFSSSATANLHFGMAVHISSTTAVNTAAMRFAPLMMTVQNSLSYAKLRVDGVTNPNTTVWGDWDFVAGTVTTNALPSTIGLTAMSIGVSRQRLFMQLEA
jgi:hypothetical protein